MYKYLNQRQSATHLHLCIFDILSVFVDLYKNEYTYIQIDLTECSANVSKPCDKYNCVPCKWITRVVCLCMNLFDHCLTMYTRIFQSYMYEDGQHFGRMVLSTINWQIIGPAWAGLPTPRAPTIHNGDKLMGYYTVLARSSAEPYSEESIIRVKTIK